MRLSVKLFRRRAKGERDVITSIGATCPATADGHNRYATPRGAAPPPLPGCLRAPAGAGFLERKEKVVTATTVTKRPRRKRAGLAAGAAAALLFAGCGSNTSSASGSAGSGSSGGTKGSPVVFHAVLGETGSEAFLGSREAKSLQALSKEINASGGIDGHPMQLDIKDNQSNPSTAVQLASAWVGQNVPFILNGSAVATDKAVDALATSNGPFIYDLSPGTHPKAGSMIFSAGISTGDDAQAYLTFLKSKGLTNVAIMNSTDGSGSDGYDQFTKQLSTPAFSSFKVVSHQTFDPTDVSVTTQLSKIKAANPQAFIIWTTGTPLGVVLKGMSSLGMEDIPTVTTDGNAAYAELTKFAGLLPKQLYFPTGPLYLPASDLTGATKAPVTAFDSAVTGAGGHGGDPWGLSYDPALLLVGALKHLGVNASAQKILNYMENLHNVPGIFGSYSTSNSDHRGVHVGSIYMTEWNGSSFAPVSGAGGTPKS